MDNFIDVTPATPGMMRLFVAEVDKDYTLTSTSLDAPILLVQIITEDDDLGRMVIDCWHRVYRARVEGLTSRPAYMLSAEVKEAVRFRCGDGLAAYPRQPTLSPYPRPGGSKKVQ